MLRKIKVGQRRHSLRRLTDSVDSKKYLENPGISIKIIETLVDTKMSSKLPLRDLSNESGFTIVEIVVAGAIAIVLGLAITTLIVDMTKHRRAAEEKSDIFGTVQEISYELKYSPPGP